SRLLWFLIGAGTTAFWIKSHHAHEWQVRNCWRDRIPQDAYPPPSAAQGQTQAMPTGAPAVPAQPSSPTPHVLPPPMPTDRWDEERLRVQNLGKQATETISELSEATLDSVLATVQSLKVKLAEARKEREQHLQQMQSLKDEQTKLFEEWRKQHD
ncbi:hypothetical protein FOMPIDRAFT_1091077, partial [Fomitopsis schrenkii]